MPSYKFYMVMKREDLRRELASRNLPTEGLNQDLVFRLGSLDDDAHGSPSTLNLPRGDGAGASPLSVTSNNEEVGASAKRVADSPAPIIMTEDGDDKTRRISRIIQISIAVLSIPVIFFLSAILSRHHIPTPLQNHSSTIIATTHHFLSAKMSDYKDLISSHVLHIFHSIKSGIQSVSAAAAAPTFITTPWDSIQHLKPFFLVQWVKNSTPALHETPFSAVAVLAFLLQSLGSGAAAVARALEEIYWHGRTRLLTLVERWLSAWTT